MISEPLFFLILWVFTSSGNFPKMLLDLYTLSIKQSFISGFICIIVFPELYSFKMIFFINLVPLVHCNHLINAFKIFTKIWGCHVMFPHHFYAKISFSHLEILSPTPNFQIWSSRYFCTTTYLNISLKILPSVWRWQ